MPISTASAVGVTPAAQSGNIGIQDFLKILTSQLNNQDPLKPVDNQEFVAQIAQFASLEQTRQLNARIDQLIASQASSQSVGILGRTVDINKNGFIVSGTVSAIDLSSGSPLITVRTPAGAFESGVTFSQIINIR